MPSTESRPPAGPALAQRLTDGGAGQLAPVEHLADRFGIVGDSHPRPFQQLPLFDVQTGATAIGVRIAADLGDQRNQVDQSAAEDLLDQLEEIFGRLRRALGEIAGGLDAVGTRNDGELSLRVFAFGDRDRQAAESVVEIDDGFLA